MTRSTVPAVISVYFAGIVGFLLFKGVPAGWLWPFAAISLSAGFLAWRWREKPEKAPGLTQLEEAALDDRTSLRDLLDAIPRLEDHRGGGSG